jgi:protein-disulfide isomerase
MQNVKKSFAHRIVTCSVGLLVVCAVAVTAYTLRFEYFTSATELTPAADSVADWKRYAETALSDQPAGSGKITVVVFSDYQCPFCRRANTVLATERKRYGRGLDVRWKQFTPSIGHPYGLAAASAALCASDQGRFQAAHELLFAGAEAGDTTAIVSIARRSGVVDMARFVSCRGASNTRERLDQDINDALALRSAGTPNFLIGAHLYRGLPSDLSRIIRYEWRHAKPI